jgi:hypothetical protein
MHSFIISVISASLAGVFFAAGASRSLKFVPTANMAPLHELLEAVKAVFSAVVVLVLSADLMGANFLDLDVAMVILLSLLSCAGGVDLKRVFCALTIMLDRLSSLDLMSDSLGHFWLRC